MYKRYFKRVLDILFSALILILSLPLTLISAIVLLFANRGKVFFFQVRPGKDRRLFKIIKFKTMTDLKDATGNLLPEEYRLTAVGRFFRKYSLDEVPQLINVLKGEMSLIGPRPLMADYLPLYDEFQDRRHEVRPGITGWAQINGRNAVSWDERFSLDIWYIDNFSFSLDCKIFLRTIMKVLKNEGGTPQNEVVMKRFTGNLNLL